MRQLTDEELEIIDKMDKVERTSEEFEKLRERLIEIEDELKKKYPSMDF